MPRRIVQIPAATQPTAEGQGLGSLLDASLGALFIALLLFCAARCALQPRQCAARPDATERRRD
jgi:hypothetical protein